ncbi:MAG: PrsW family intramembrane metalloprotease [Reyranellaceae bacterium]
MLDLIILLAAVAPAFLVLRIFIRWDLFPEPNRVILATFFWGMVSVIPVLAIGYVAYEPLMAIQDPFWGPVAVAFLGAAIPEELTKFAVLFFYCMRHSHFDEPMDGLVYGMTASLGFAALENIFYLMSAGPDWVEVALLRAFLSVPSHGLDGVLMGFFAGLARFEPQRAGRWWLLCLLVPMSLHGLYDAPLFLAGIDEPAGSGGEQAAFVLVPLLVVAIQLVWAIWLFRRLNRDQQALLARQASQ